MKIHSSLSVLNFIVLTLTAGSVYSQSDNLTRFHHYDDDSHHITLSGFSSGGAFAQQLQFSYPDLFEGIAVFSHNFYRCGLPNGKIEDYDRLCTILRNTPKQDLYDPNLVHQDIQDYFKENLIGDPKLLKDKRLYVYTGLRSFLFSPDLSLGILNVYERYINNEEAIRTRVQDAAFALPTNNDYGPSCTENVGINTSFIGNCGFSGAFEALNFLLGDRVKNKPNPKEPVRLEKLVEFDQDEFYQDLLSEKHQMDTTGYYYIPRNCTGVDHNCLIHFYFHGCRSGREFAQDKHVINSGFLEVAELNDIIMVFPQIQSLDPVNKGGCWDTFGLNGPLYATKEGVQVKIVKRMIDRVLGHRSFSEEYSSESNDTTELLQHSTANAVDEIKIAIGDIMKEFQ